MLIQANKKWKKENKRSEREKRQKNALNEERKKEMLNDKKNKIKRASGEMKRVLTNATHVHVATYYFISNDFIQNYQHDIRAITY